jgi:hypothetical protein
MLVRGARAMLQPLQFLLLSRNMLSRIASGRRIGTACQSFLTHFGSPPVVCSDVWRLGSFKSGTRPIHILWALLWMHTYLTEKVLCSLLGVAPNTFRKWGLPIVKSISALSSSVVRYRLYEG